MGEMSMGEKISCQATRMGSKLCYLLASAVRSAQRQPLDSGDRLKQFQDARHVFGRLKRQGDD
jgi:hypothetical protein